MRRPRRRKVKRRRPARPPESGRIPITVRPVAASEEEAALRVIREHDELDANAARRYYTEYFYSKARSKDRILVAVTRRSQVVGVTGYFTDVAEPRGVFWLAWTYVLPAYRRFGVGSRLLGAVERDLRRHGGRKLYLNTSSHALYRGAIRFYLDHGFKWEGYLRDYYRKGEDVIILGKTL
jgi:GNAT superfamily N-acetyltransferase